MPTEAWEAEKTWMTTWRDALDEFTGLAAEHYTLTDPSWISFGAGWICLWVAVWQYAYGSIHQIHAVLITVMSVASMLEIIAEEAVWMVSLTYFLLDGLDSVRVGKWVMLVAHHFPTLGLFAAVFVFPNMLPLRYCSKVLLIEITTPLLLRWRKSKRKSDFQAFMLAFFLVRVCYMSWLAVQFYNDIGGWVSWLAGALLVVNIFWFCQQVGMLFNYKESDVAKESGTAEDLSLRKDN